jgi:hypothetical protein
MKEKVWEAGSPAVETIINDPSCFGVLGTLAEVLRGFNTPQPGKHSLEEVNFDDDDDDDDDEDKDKFRLDPDASERILSALGESMAKFHSGSSTIKQAPSALLRGRVDHFNRRNTKWRIVVRDCQFRKRVDLDKNRRMRERPSLWEVSEQNEGANNDDPTKVCVELLAFNDFE